MQLVFFCAIAVASLLALSIVALILMWKQIQYQNRQIQTLTNMATAKNLETFQSLQMTTLSHQSHQSEIDPVNPLNDEAVAMRLAENYEKAGMDPSMAFAHDDSEFLGEIGGIDAIRTY